MSTLGSEPSGDVVLLCTVSLEDACRCWEDDVFRMNEALANVGLIRSRVSMGSKRHIVLGDAKKSFILVVSTTIA